MSVNDELTENTEASVIEAEQQNSEETKNTSDNQNFVPEKRDKKAAKKRLKKVFKIVIIAFLVIGVLCGALYLILKYAFPAEAPYGYDDRYFFPADYSKNIFEDEKYMSLNRTIYYKDFGYTYSLTKENVDTIPGSARFLYDYLNCIIEGRYSDYPSYFTNDYISSNESQVSKNLTIPLYEKFTMQGLYDIKITRVNYDGDPEKDGFTVEQYLITYRIFENNGTFRRDIIPGESRELLYTVYTNGDLTKINEIGFINVISEAK